ncbi:serine threonine protein kinase CMGC group [Coemansia aciculifera]|uniref:Serine threonine protein kinase CMGC group n=1 Tax=Coemansia aciculifera TaxID=417176 RepID=A0A9W8M5J4_9FUNG|nr:serine threonine protein kinase CMGC group [Coemansia aciculifera]
MSVLSFVTSFFRSRNNRVDPSNDSAATSKPQFRPTSGTPSLATINKRNANLTSKHQQQLPSKNAYATASNTSTNNDQSNQLRRIFTSSKIHPRPLNPKLADNDYSLTNGSTRSLQQKAEPSCDDRDGHYIVVPGRDFNSRFKIRRLLGQGTFGKVMECEDAASGRLVAIKVIRAVPKYRDAAKIEIRVLQTLQRNDPTNTFQCMHVNETFDHRNHVCMVFDLLGPSVFDFLKENEFRPFSLHHVQLFAEQLLRSVAFLHGLNLVHTDLKPENILLESGEFDIVPFGNVQGANTRMLKSTNIRLIDFGSATFNNEYHSQVVSTRHYRAPEIILNLGWSFPCDMWSIGCIILELLTGEALFQTHDNNEHLAMMEVVVGRAPAHIVRSVAADLRPKFFRSDGTARYPAPDQPRQSQKGLRLMRPLDILVQPGINPIYANLHDLLFRLLQYDPRARITAKEACEHQFFRYRVGPDGRLVNRPPPTPQQPQQQPLQQPIPPQPVLASAADVSNHSIVYQRLHRPSFPSASAAVPQIPAVAAVASPVGTSFMYSNGPARAPLRVGEYSISSANNTSQQPLSAHHHQQLAPTTPKATLSSQQHPAAAAAQFGGYYYRDPPAANPHSMYQPPEYTSRPVTHYQQQAPPQLHLPQQHSRGHADAYPWHYANGANAATIHTPTGNNNNNGPSLAASNAAPVAGYEPHSADMSSQSRSGGKRKAGAPIDSGYFPEPLGSVADGYPASGVHNGHSSPIAGGPPNSGLGASRPMPRNFSSGSLFTTAPLTTAGSLASPGGYATNNKGCNLPPFVSHAATQPVAAVAAANGGSVNLPPQHPYHQQRHHLLGSHSSSGAMASVGQVASNGLTTRLPIDANATPTLTIASTATPTPGSTSTQLGNGAPLHAVEGNSTLAAGTHKLAGRSLPSLPLSNGMPPRTNFADTTQQQQQQNASYYYRQNVAAHKLQPPVSPVAHSQQMHANRSGYPNLPPAQMLLQQVPPVQQHVSNALGGHGDYAHHHHQQFASPSTAHHYPNY